MNHRDDAPYIEQSGAEEELRRSLRFERDRAGIPHIHWVCPVCAGPVQHDEVRLIQVLGVTNVEGPSMQDLVCHCGHKHGEKEGCGYGIQVEVPGRLLDRESEDPQDSEPAAVETLSDADRRWLKKAQDEELAALPAVRARADKWAAALTSALGVVGLAALLEGPDVFKGLEEVPRTIAKIVFFLAAALALVAIYRATHAAQGTRGRILGESGRAYRTYAQEQITSSDRLLDGAQRATAGAIVLVLIAGGLLWFGPRTASSPTLVDVQGTALCPADGGDAVTTINDATYVIRCK